DLIFMDHMMPEMDGVETTRIIRRLYPDYDNVPILALTANAMDGTKEMFLEEGMNDFIAKPIELRTLISKVKQWLPAEKVVKGAPKREKKSPESEAEGKLEIGDLDTDYALKLLGGKPLYLSVLSDYYAAINTKSEKIKKLEEEENWPEYTVEVHALKSASRQIGAMALADLAAEMEKAGNAQDAASIHEHTGKMLWMYLSYEPVIRPFVADKVKAEKEKPTKGEASKDMLLTAFINFREALESLDMDNVENFLEELKSYSYSTESSRYLTSLVEAAENYDIDACEETLTNWEDFLTGKSKIGGGNA
ncbi:MAG: response regulator, partial [Lachnospiraceae bacterium]|nr:response regulator [Lachnospiraceae bacterium]